MCSSFSVGNYSNLGQRPRNRWFVGSDFLFQLFHPHQQWSVAFGHKPPISIHLIIGYLTSQFLLGPKWSLLSHVWFPHVPIILCSSCGFKKSQTISDPNISSRPRAAFRTPMELSRRSQRTCSTRSLVANPGGHRRDENLGDESQKG